ncbi:MAG TPA: MltA domain-containing protein [Pseudomonadota bacterium]|nr:MltA domain-containing protein [Pseudomonadota bacterium]
MRHFGLGIAVSLLCLAELKTARAKKSPERPAGKALCDDADAGSLVAAIDRELAAFQEMPSAHRLRLAGRDVDKQVYVEQILLPIRAAAQKGNATLCRLLSKKLKLRSLAGKARVTAYYHPVVRGSVTAKPPFLVPLYRRPSDEVFVHKTTEEILSGALSERGLELVYVDSLATALHVHIEGSVTVALEDGREINLTTDGHNGHAYQNPLRLLVQDKVIPSDFQAAPAHSRTHAFVLAHPDILRKYWSKNPHFVFFKETPLRGTGKFGELVAGRSIAIDPRHVPMGSVLLLRTSVSTMGQDAHTSHKTITRLVLAQDTGAAIVGPKRVDLFLGSGDDARFAAAHTNQLGDLWLVMPPKPLRPQTH